MADEGGGTNLFQDMYKNFPIFTTVSIIVLLYLFWYHTGGVERGEERRAAGENAVFVEVKGVPDSFGEEELFGVSEVETVEEILEEN